MLVTLVIILSKAVGFGRDMVTTAYFGRTMENDAYVSAYSLFYLPVLLFNSCISATLIPLFVEERERFSLKHSNRFASNSINLFSLAALVVSALMYILAGPLVNLVYHGFSPEKAALTARLTHIMVLALVFNVASIAVAWGVFAANVLQLLVLIPFLRGWFTYTPMLNAGDERFRKLMRLALPAMLSMGVSELNHMIDHALASGLPEGTLTSMTSAYRLITFVQGILLVPLTTVMFSKMSRRVAEDDVRGALKLLRRSVLVITMVVLPVVAVGAVLSSDVIQFAYMRGKFTMDDVRVTAGVLMFYIIGIPAFGLRDFFSRVFHSLKDTKTPFRVSCMVVAINVVLNVILRKFMGANGLAFATSIAGYCGMTAMVLLLKKRFGRIGTRRTTRELCKIVAATAVCTAVCVALNRAVPPAEGTLKVTLRLVVCGGASIVAYLACAWALGLNTLKKLVGGRRR